MAAENFRSRRPLPTVSIMAREVLRITILMIMISLRPFAFKKLFVLVIAILCLSSAACFADSLFMMNRSSALDAAAVTGLSEQKISAPSLHGAVDVPRKMALPYFAGSDVSSANAGALLS